MKKLKFIISLCLMSVVVCISVIPRSNVTDGLAPLNLHTLHTVTSFGFVDHHARVNVDFTGYEDTSNLRIDVKIEKRNFMFFRETVVSESYFAQAESYHSEFFYPLYADGVYDCTVTYTVTGDYGKDTISFTDTQTYKTSDHTEHTHVWNFQTTEPTFEKEGVERKFCYCGKSESTVLEKLQFQGPSPTPSNNNSVLNSFIPSTGASNSKMTDQSASLNQPFNGFSGYQSYCNCMSCMWERSTAAIRAATPKKPTSPTVKTTDPWYTPYMEPNKPSTCRRFNR